MASFGTLCLLLGFGLLAGSAGGYAFEAMRLTSRTPFTATLAVVLALVGAGSKAGLIPPRVWLPLAHPAAPSHVSALIIGVMTKVGVHGFIRVVFDLAGPSNPWLGLVVLPLGGVTAMLVSSTFARQPALRIVLVAGLLIAFGVLIPRLQDIVFGEPTGKAYSARASQTEVTAR